MDVQDSQKDWQDSQKNWHDSPQDWSGPDGDEPAVAPALPAGADQRDAPRFTLLLRCAKLIVDGREYICVLRDASDTGAKLRLFHPMPDGRVLELEMPDGSRHAFDTVWEREGHAGVRFHQRIDIRELLDDRTDRPRRQLRLQTASKARLAAPSLADRGELREGRIVNISQQGACIESDAPLRLRELVRIESDQLPTIHARVCWRRAPLYGLVFETGFQLEELARLLERSQKAADPTPGTRSAA